MDSEYLNLIVEISVTVYVFLLGLPILVSQIFLPDDLRRMSKKNYSGNIQWPLLSLTIILVLILAVAYPASQFPASKELATFLFVLMLALTLWYAYVNLIRSQGYRAKIIDVIKRKILKKYRKTGAIDQAYLEDLEYLGVYSKGGTETRYVIEALEELLNSITEVREVTSDNDSLINIVEVLCSSVANSIEPGSRQNMVEVLTIYKGILMELNAYSTKENQLIYGNETRKLKDCTTKIALTSLKRDYSDMMPLILNVLTLIPRSSDKLFDIGLLALGKNQYQIAANVLAEIMDRDNKDYLTMNNYLGLIAHFYFAGNTARQCATRSMENNKIQPSEKELKGAMEYHYIMSNFATVDQLEQLYLTYYPRKSKARML